MRSSTPDQNLASQEILKVDSRGHIQIPPERRQALLEEFDRSGMSGAAFCRHYGLKYNTFAHWIRARRKKQERKEEKGERRFLMIEAKPEAPSNDECLRVDLPNGCHLSIHSMKEAELAAALIRSLGTGK